MEQKVEPLELHSETISKKVYGIEHYYVLFHNRSLLPKKESYHKNMMAKYIKLQATLFINCCTFLEWLIQSNTY